LTFIDLGAMAFGTVIGWFTYFVNRHRGEVKLTDVATIIGALGGGAVLALFPQASRLFAAYGLGLAFGFFGYFIVLVVLVWRQEDWSFAWFLDGRRPPLDQGQVRPKNRDTPMGTPNDHAG
jgi:hypothetical protein